MRNTDFIRTAAILLLCIFLLIPAPLHAAAKKKPAAPPTPQIPVVYTTIPWITSMAQFLVGTTLKIQPLTAWANTGTLKNLRKIDRNALVVALDPKDAAKYGLTPGRQGLYLLYENLPVRDSRRSTLPFDPSALPFISQRLLIVIAELEPENYPFYQRRLAEFQSRLESTLEVGRSLIKEARLLDLTGSTSPWIQAACDNAVRPPEDLWLAWTSGERMSELAPAIEEANRRNWQIVIDIWTPAAIRKQVMGVHKNIFLQQPTGDYNFFTYLHDIYLEIWSATIRK